MQKEKDSVDETHFHKSLQELRDFSSQLYHTAEYCEATFLAAEDKRIIMENTKQYISRAVVSAVEHLGSISANLETSLFKSSNINPETNRKIDSLKMRIEECQLRSHKRALAKFHFTPPDFSRHHCRYILPPSTDPESMNVVSRVSEDGVEAKSEKGDEFETEEPLFVHTYNCKPSLVENSARHIEKDSVIPPPVVPVRGDGLSILPKSEQSVFQFKEARKLKRSATNRKGVHNRDMAWLIRRGKQILA